MLHSKVYVKSNVCTYALSPFANLTKLEKSNFTYVVLHLWSRLTLLLRFYKNPNITGNTRYRDSIFGWEIDKTYGDIMEQ